MKSTFDAGVSRQMSCDWTDRVISRRGASVYQLDQAWNYHYPNNFREADVSSLLGTNSIRFRFRFRSDPIYQVDYGEGSPRVTYFEIYNDGDCDSTVYDTVQVAETVYDTLYVTDTLTYVDTVEYPIMVTVFDTVPLFAIIYDTVLVVETLYIYDTIPYCIDYSCVDTIVFYDCDTVILYTPDPCPCNGGKIKVCVNGQTLCLPRSQVTPEMQQGGCSGHPCPGVGRWGVQIYPNPTRGMIRIIGGDNYEMYDIYGTLVRTGPVTGLIELLDLPPGTYTVRVYKDDESITEKLVIQ